MLWRSALASRSLASLRLRWWQSCPPPSPSCRCPMLGRPAGARPLADSGRDRHPCARHRLPLRARSGGAEMAMDQLGIGCGNSAMDLGLDRLHDLRLEGRQLRQDLRLAWRRHCSAALVLSDRLRDPRRGGTERGDRASNYAGEARSGAGLTRSIHSTLAAMPASEKNSELADVPGRTVGPSTRRW